MYWINLSYRIRNRCSHHRQNHCWHINCKTDRHTDRSLYTFCSYYHYYQPSRLEHILLKDRDKLYTGYVIQFWSEYTFLQARFSQNIAVMKKFLFKPQFVLCYSKNSARDRAQGSLTRLHAHFPRPQHRLFIIFQKFKLIKNFGNRVF